MMIYINTVYWKNVLKKNTKRTLRCTEQKICFEYGSSKIFNKQIIKKKYLELNVKYLQKIKSTKTHTCLIKHWLFLLFIKSVVIIKTKN